MQSVLERKLINKMLCVRCNYDRLVKKIKGKDQPTTMEIECPEQENTANGEASFLSYKAKLINIDNCVINETVFPGLNHLNSTRRRKM